MKTPFRFFLEVQGVLTEHEVRHPTQLDQNGEQCLPVIQNGTRTGLAIGRASGLESFIREHDSNGTIFTWMAVAVYSYSHTDSAFSASGESGSVVVDGEGHVVGMIVGGAGSVERDKTDVTYLTPYHWLEERIKQAFPHSTCIQLCQWSLGGQKTAALAALVSVFLHFRSSICSSFLKSILSYFARWAAARLVCFLCP